MENQNNIYAYYPNGKKYGYYNNLTELSKKVGRKLVTQTNERFFYKYLGLNINIVRKFNALSKPMFLLKKEDIECIVFDKYIRNSRSIIKLITCITNSYSDFHGRILKKEYLIVYRDLSIIATMYNSWTVAEFTGINSDKIGVTTARWKNKILKQPSGIFTTTHPKGFTVMDRETYDYIKEHYKILY